MKKQAGKFIVLMWVRRDGGKTVDKLWDGPHDTKQQAEQAKKDWRETHAERWVRGHVEER